MTSLAHSPAEAPAATASASPPSTSPAVAMQTGRAEQPRSAAVRRRRRVLYLVDHSTTAIAYAEDHVMRPSRVRVVHALVHSLGLDGQSNGHRADVLLSEKPPLPVGGTDEEGPVLVVAHARPASFAEMNVFHRTAYLECLRSAPRICADPFDEVALSLQKEFDVPVATKIGDCPLFPEVWDLVASQAGASLACAEALVQGKADVAINWSGGLHHAAAAHASGFCFVNDIVLCIQRLLRRYQRVLYVDLDVHHGDGVEGAFDGNTRVLTLSLHQFGDGFFPGTGDYADSEDSTSSALSWTSAALAQARSAGRFAVNVPLPARTGDAAYLLSFRTALSAAVRCFAPETLVLQCGADTIAGDLIGRLCVTTHTHTQCVADALSLNLPTVLLGGGGYHVYHTARCWAVHTATALGRTALQLPNYIPRADPYYLDHRKECAPLRPTLHVGLDPDVDRPLSFAESLRHWRRLCTSVHAQMRAARTLRQSFTRTVSAASASTRRLLLSEQLLTGQQPVPRTTPPDGGSEVRSTTQHRRRTPMRIEGDASTVRTDASAAALEQLPRHSRKKKKTLKEGSEAGERPRKTRKGEENERAASEAGSDQTRVEVTANADSAEPSH